MNHFEDVLIRAPGRAHRDQTGGSSARRLRRGAGQLLGVAVLAAALAALAGPPVRAVQADGEKLRIVFADPATKKVLKGLGLRAGTEHVFLVRVENPQEKARKVTVEVTGDGGEARLMKKDIEVPAGGAAAVAFDPVPKSVELSGFLRFHVFGADDKSLAERVVRLEDPRDYIEVNGPRYSPRRRVLTVPVEKLDRLAGSCEVDLVVSPERIPCLAPEQDVTRDVHRVLNDETRTAELRVGNLKLKAEDRAKARGKARTRNGFVYLTVDGYQRAFTLFTTFAEPGPRYPVRIDEQILRLVAAPYTRPGPYPVRVEADNVPDDWTVALTVEGGQVFKHKGGRVKKFLVAVKDGALAVTPQVSDWTQELKLQGVLGTRELRVELLDVKGDPQPFLDSALLDIDKRPTEIKRTVVVTDSKPEVNITDLPKGYRPGAALPVRAQATDPRSRITEVVFFLGKLPKEGTPPADRVVGKPDGQGRYAAELKVPAEQKGPLQVGVLATNAVGLTSPGERVVDPLPPPVAVKPSIKGQVVAGPLPQSGLQVWLISQNMNRAIETTDADGRFEFKNVDPGAYRVYSQRNGAKDRGHQDVIIKEGDQPKDVTINLKRGG